MGNWTCPWCGALRPARARDCTKCGAGPADTYGRQRDACVHEYDSADPVQKCERCGQMKPILIDGHSSRSVTCTFKKESTDA